MHIKKINIQNYKSLFRLEIVDLQPFKVTKAFFLQILNPTGVVLTYLMVVRFFTNKLCGDLLKSLFNKIPLGVKYL